MRKRSWSCREGWTISSGIMATGMVLQLSVGSITPEWFRFPLNLIFGALFLASLLWMALFYRKSRVFVWLSGRSAAVTSLSSLLFLLIVMGLTPQVGWMQMTVSWPFLLVVFFLLSVLGSVTLQRVGKPRWDNIGFVWIHAGVFIALFSAVLGSSDLQRVYLSAPLNETVHKATYMQNRVELPFSIELKSFIVEEYPPKVMAVDHSTGMEIKLWEWEIEMANYLPGAAVMANEDTVYCVPFHTRGAAAALYIKACQTPTATQTEGWISSGSYMFPGATLRLNDSVSLVMPNPEPKRFTSDVTVHTQHNGRVDALIEVNKPLSVEGWKIYQYSYDLAKGKWSEYSVFELVRDPWQPAVWLGIWMLMAGSIFFFFTTLRKND